MYLDLNMIANITAVIIICSIIFYHFITPLNELEEKKLAEKRRNKKIKAYFDFDESEYIANKEFKKNMNPNGEFYECDDKLYEFPSIASALLKYKKHEWIIVAFEKSKKVDLMWLNKGVSRESVSVILPIEKIASIAAENSHSSVMIFHNHPNSNPSEYDCSNPSDQDKRSAKIISDKLSKKGINLIEFICERGNHYQYFDNYVKQFIPIKPILADIKFINDKTKFQNASLRFEYLFN